MKYVYVRVYVMMNVYRSSQHFRCNGNQKHSMRQKQIFVDLFEGSSNQALHAHTLVCC